MKLSRLAFWKVPTLTPAEQNDQNQCVHLWTNWTEPTESTVKVGALFSPETSDHDVLLQTRKCLKCNLHQRHSA